MSKKLNTLFSLGVALLGLLFSPTPSAMAVNFMWNNTGTTWNSGSSWVGGVAPASNSSANPDTVQFGSMTANFNTVYLASNRTTLGATFDAGANAYTFTTDAVTPLRLGISTSGIANNSSATQTFNLGVDLIQGNSTWQSVAGGSLIFNSGIGLNSGTSTANRTLTVAGAGNFTVNQAIANGGQSTAGLVTVTATGTTTFSGNNTYDGRTTMNATGGTLTLSGDNSGAAGGVTLTAGTLNINNNNALGSGALNLAGTGATINNTSGSAVVNAGNQAWTWENGLSFGATGNTAANDLNLGTGVVTASSSRTIALAGTGTKLTIGAVNITSTSTGRTITANGAENTLEIGGLTLSANTTAAVTVTLDGTANLGVTGAIVNGQSFANGVQIKGTGTKTFSAANTYTGETEIVSGATLSYGANNVTLDTGGRMLVNGGTLNIGSYNDTVSSVRVNAGGAINGTGTLTTTGSFTLSDNNTVNANLAGATMTLSKIGVGFESLLNGNNTYSGATSVSSGTLKLGSNTALGSTAAGTSVSSTGFLDLNGKTVGAEALTFTGTGGLLNSSALAASQSGTVAVGDLTTVNTTGDITLSGNLIGIAGKSLTKEGAGTLKLSSSGSTLAGTLKVSAGTLLVTGNGNVSTSSSIVDGGTLRVNGTAGGVTVNNGGSLEGNGTVGAVNLTTGSYLNPGNSPGLLTASSATWGAGSYYNWEIDSNASIALAGTNWDLFSVTGAFDMSALSSSAQMNLVLNSLSGFDLTSSTRREWVIAKAGSFIGTGLADGTNVTDLFNINATAFNNGDIPTSGFRVEVATDVNNLRTLNLMAIPEPSTGSLMMFGLGGLVLTRFLRRKVS